MNFGNDISGEGKKIIREIIKDLKQRGGSNRELRKLIPYLGSLDDEGVKQVALLSKKKISPEDLRKVAKNIMELEQNIEMNIQDLIIQGRYQEALDFIIETKGQIQILSKYGLDVREAKVILLELEKEWKHKRDLQRSLQ